MAHIRHVEVVANLASGGVSKDAPDEIEKIFADHGIAAHVCAPETHELDNCLRAAVDAAPDLLVTLAGDGTARSAAELCGPDGPVLAPLPGGTMNVLPHALYGPRSWQDALSLALAEGAPRNLSGGEVEGRPFLVAAIIGAPALWGAAREAARYHEPIQAISWARRAMRRAFSGRLRYSLDGAPREKAEALIFTCPQVSRMMSDEDRALEAAVLDLRGAADAFRLGVNALLRDWRDDPAVITRPCRTARTWGAGGIPALLDGELVRLHPAAEVTFRPKIAKVLALPKNV